MLSAEASLIRRRFWNLFALLVACAWAILRIGPQTSTDIAGDAHRAFGWPNPSLDALQAYTRTSPIGPLIYQLFDHESTLLYVALHLLVAIVGIGLIALWASISVESVDQRWRAGRLVVLSPVVASVFVSVGNYDPFTLLGLALLLWAWRFSNRWLIVFSGVYLGFQHFEQSLIAVLSFSIAVVGLKELLPSGLANRRTPLYALAGVILGKLLLSVVLVGLGISATQGRSAYVTDQSWVRLAILESVNHFPVLLMSLFAGLWVIIVLCFTLTSNRRQRMLLMLAILIPFLGCIITLAQTRVFVMTALPLTALAIVVCLSHKWNSTGLKFLLVAEAAAWLVVPQHLYISPGFGAHIFPTNALDYSIMFVQQLVGLKF
jgi:hypothetical protein